MNLEHKFVNRSRKYTIQLTTKYIFVFYEPALSCIFNIKEQIKKKKGSNRKPLRKFYLKCSGNKINLNS